VCSVAMESSVGVVEGTTLPLMPSFRTWATGEQRELQCLRRYRMASGWLGAPGF